ncbi:hypothetical protein SLEP1_g13866 [Rubroshorea leprosula]|uniref:ATP-dependent DNA ligase family profile domain-containing protein n=1 Tax=Rubroshorea leprosula TaxID=152421 RepID=A0AAV5IRB9_9ROSI|nr:hypothetical protein SLEP1_g13866 [Rubroshorea leprosula]
MSSRPSAFDILMSNALSASKKSPSSFSYRKKCGRAADRITAAHEGLELGIGDASIIKALAEAFGRTEALVKNQFKEKGDLGLVAQTSRSSQSMMRKPDPLTVAKVFYAFRLIAKESGKDSQEKKRNCIKSLLVAATDCEPQYLTCLLQDTIFPALLKDGMWDIPKTCCFTLGVRIEPMLTKPTKGVGEIVNKFPDIKFVCDYKYDRERAQVHYMDNDSVEIYSWDAEQNTEEFPDVVAAVARLKKSHVKSFVLDCAWQKTSQNVDVKDIKVDVCTFTFDVLYLNGQPLILEQLNVHKEWPHDSFEEEPRFFQFAVTLKSNDIEEIQKFLDAAVSASCEDYMDNIGDTFDLVPFAAFHGHGKWTGVYGAFLLACYDCNNEEFQSICKIGSGFSEAKLEELSASLHSRVIPKPKPSYVFGETLDPDVWFEPSEVCEVKAADLTISPCSSCNSWGHGSC